jgi:AcrR family transcriptional regulator
MKVPFINREERREELLDAADRAIAVAGPDVSMAAIAAEAGITKPILYRHFADKAGLYRALAERHTAELLAAVRHGLTTKGDLRARCVAAVDAYLGTIEAQPAVYRFLVHRAAAEEPSVAGHVALFQQRLAAELATGIAIELGVAPSPRTTAWAHGLVGMIRAAGEWWLEARTMSRAELVEALVDLMLGELATAADSLLI